MERLARTRRYFGLAAGAASSRAPAVRGERRPVRRRVGRGAWLTSEDATAAARERDESSVRDVQLLQPQSIRQASARSNSITQFVSHVLPPSAEKDCSQSGDGVVKRDQSKRMRIGFPSSVSAPSNLPIPPSKEP